MLEIWNVEPLYSSGLSRRLRARSTRSFQSSLSSSSARALAAAQHRHHQAAAVGGDRHADVDAGAFHQLVLRLVAPVHLGELLHRQRAGLGDGDRDRSALRLGSLDQRAQLDVTGDVESRHAERGGHDLTDRLFQLGHRPTVTRHIDLRETGRGRRASRLGGLHVGRHDHTPHGPLPLMVFRSIRRAAGKDARIRCGAAALRTRRHTPDAARARSAQGRPALRSPHGGPGLCGRGYRGPPGRQPPDPDFPTR